MDTDSIFTLHEPGAPKIDNGIYLGDFTCEVECYRKGSYIKEFCSAGPKNYDYCVAVGGDPTKEVYVCKCRGIRINSGNLDIVNYSNLKKERFPN